jgi:hypothetical protein
LTRDFRREKREEEGKETKSIEAEPLRRRAHTLDHREKKVVMLPTQSRKMMFGCREMQHALPKECVCLQLVGVCIAHANYFYFF